MVMSVQACNGRSIYAELCEGAEALEQQLQLLGTERLTVADGITMHSGTVCGCVPRKTKGCVPIASYCFIQKKKRKKKEAVCQKEAVCPLKL